MNRANSTSPGLSTIQVGALVVGVLGVVLSIVAAVINVEQFYESYIFGFLFWVELSLGCLALLMIHNLVNGRWGFAVRRFLAAGARTIPLMALLFVPIIFGLGTIYEWAAAPAAPGPLQNSDFYLAPPFFIIRAVVFFAIWIALAYLITGWSYKHDETADPQLLVRIRQLSVAGMILFMITASLAAIDWNMSLVPDWFSSVFGWLTISREVLLAFGFALIVLALVWNTRPLADVLNNRAMTDLAALLLVFVMIWTYLSFIQYVVMWSANLSSKVVWYTIHFAGSWSGFFMLLVAVQAAVLLLLMVPGLKKNRGVLVGLAALLIVLRLGEMFWLVMPIYRPGFSLQWQDLAIVVGIGGLWVAFFLWSLVGNSLVPINHPALNEHATGHGGEEYVSSPQVS
ncbi:MAG: hypothetical protein ACFB51_21280 [Anaerolineae bacterium]